MTGESGGNSEMPEGTELAAAHARGTVGTGQVRAPTMATPDGSAPYWRAGLSSDERICPSMRDTVNDDEILAIQEAVRSGNHSEEWSFAVTDSIARSWRHSGDSP